MSKKMTVVLLCAIIIMVLTTLLNTALVIAQVGGSPSVALPFRRFLGLLGLNNDSIQWHKSEVERLTMLVSIPVGDRNMGDTAGNPINWTQARIDKANTLIQEHYDRLTELGEGSWTYAYVPDVIVP